jgi:outer membrane protein assembly factor BamB
MLRKAGLVLGLVTLFAPPVAAVIIRLTPLGEVLDESTFIVTARVEALDPGRPAMVLAVDAALKGKPGFRKLPVLLSGDAGSVRRKEPPQLLKRLAVKLPVVLFISRRDTEYTAFAYTNGTWFSLTGVTVEGEVRWSFAHLEPYLRRTYRGTTAEMIATVRDALAGKRKAPPPEKKEKPGLGPEVSRRGEPAGLSRRDKPGGSLMGEGGSLTGGNNTATAPYQPPVRGVIPTVLVGGPLALLALLFPTLFGGWRRWLALLTAAGTASTLFLLQWCLPESLPGAWLRTPAALWTLMTAVYVAGLFHAWQRHLHRVQAGEAPLLAGPWELSLLWSISLMGILWVGVFRYLNQPILAAEWWPVAVFCIGLWLAAGYVTWTWLRGPRLVPALASEAVVLGGLVLGSVLVAPNVLPRARAAGAVEAAAGGPEHIAPRLVWTFRLPQRGGISSSPVVAGERIYIAAAHDSVFRPHGALYCLDRATGKPLWSFSDGGKMKPVHSTPAIVGGRLYIGEGLHQDLDCKVYCLDAQTGKKLWEFQTTSHTEATPAVDGTRLYVGAGDDGLYCLDAVKGARVWNFPAFHIDATPLVADGRVYAGAGIGDVFQTTALLCLDAATGKPRWRYNTDLPVWCRPVVSRGRVYVASGNGRLNEGDANPAGAVECLRAEDGGRVWRRKFADGVLGRMAADRERLYLGCRDGFFYCLRRADGEPMWRRDLGSPMVAGAVVEVCSCCETSTGRVYAASAGGYTVCLRASSGELIWEKDLGEPAPVELIATPALDVRPGEDGREVRRLYVALTLALSPRAGELHCYEERRAGE